MTHHITDEKIAKLHDSMFPAPYDGHANVIRFARAVLALAAPAPAVPSDVLSLPKYRAWLYVKEHGEWPKGIDRAWMKDDMGRHNDSVVAREVIQELAAALTAAPTPPAQGEKLVRFCPGCGSVGDVPDTFRDCCPDGSNARMIPEDLATRCHDLFLLALAGAKAQQPAVPEDVARLNKQMLEALEAIASDYAERFDLSSPSTNPGIKSTIAQARAAIDAAHGITAGKEG